MQLPPQRRECRGQRLELLEPRRWKKSPVGLTSTLGWRYCHHRSFGAHKAEPLLIPGRCKWELDWTNCHCQDDMPSPGDTLKYQQVRRKKQVSPPAQPQFLSGTCSRGETWFRRAPASQSQSSEAGFGAERRWLTPWPFHPFMMWFIQCSLCVSDPEALR